MKVAKDIVEEAVQAARKVKSSAFELARETLAEAMAPTMKKIVSENINEELGGSGDPPGNYDEDGEQKRIGDNQAAVGDTGEDLSDEGDGPAVIEASLDEEDWEEEGEEEIDFEEDVDDELDLGDENDIEVDTDMDVDDDDDVIEIVEDDDEDIESIDDEEEEIVVDDEEEIDDLENIEMEASLKRETKLKKENNVLAKRCKKLETAVTSLKDKFNEVNLFNARLAGATKLMREVTLTDREKNRLVNKFDECESVNEVRRVYSALREAYRTSSKNRSKAPKKSIKPVNNTLNENTEYGRMQELAGILE